MEGGPEIRVNAIRARGCPGASEKSPLGACQGCGLAILSQQCLVEHLHQFSAAGIIHFPQRRQQGGRSCVEETPAQADYFIDATDNGAARLAGAECHQGATREIEVENFDGA